MKLRIAVTDACIFKDLYEELKGNGVIFPEEKNFQFMKKIDEERFKKNYKKFLDVYEKGEEEEKMKESKKDALKQKQVKE